jgi:hypothetical protein
VNKHRRLAKLEEQRAKAERAAQFPAIRITWDTSVPEVSPEGSGGKPRALTMHLHPGSEAMPAPAWMGDEAEPVPSAQPAPRGQRPRRPTVEEQAAAIEVLRERARRGTFAGELPPSAEDIRADQARRGALRKDAALVRRVGRSAAAAPLSGRV